MIVDVNGLATELGEDPTVQTVVARLDVGGERRGVAVAVDAEVVPRSQWEHRRLREGDHVEVVTAIQGG